MKTYKVIKAYTLFVFLLFFFACTEENEIVRPVEDMMSKESHALKNNTAANLGANSGFWSITNKSINHSPHGNHSAISAHNCYSTSSSSKTTNLAATEAKVASALSKNADLIEFDLIDINGAVLVSHDDATSASKFFQLHEILSYSTLLNSSASLFLEIKENNPSLSFVRSILSTIQTYNYAHSGRPAFIRAFNGSRTGALTHAKTLLNTEFTNLKPYVFLSELYGTSQLNTSSPATMHNRILTAKNNGYHMVEFAYNVKNLFSYIMYAKSLGLAINIFTVPTSMGEVYVSLFREEADAITCDYDIAKARSDVQENNALLYVNTALQSQHSNSVGYYRTGTAQYSATVNGTNQPYKLYDGTGEDRYGVSLVFRGSPSNDHIKTYDGDNSASNGFFVSAVVNFDELSSTSNTRVLVGKADNSGFSLEMKSGKIRFGVHVNGSYRYANYNLSNFNGTDSYCIIGCYDGNGAVRLWVNNIHRGNTGAYSGGVKTNNSPIVLGADPQGSSNTRFYGKFKLQRVQVLNWRNH